MEMSRIEALGFSKKIDAVLNSDTELAFSVVYALNKTKSKMKGMIEEIEEMLSASKKQERILNETYCRKDDGGKPIIVENQYTGLEKGTIPEYDEKAEKLVADRISFLSDVVDVDIHNINKDDIPKNGKAFILETLCRFVD